jgi:hypothetical protein
MTCLQDFSPRNFLVATLALLSPVCCRCQSGAQPGPALETPPDVVLHGTVTGKQMNTYIEDPFTVPAGTYRVTLTLSYSGKEQKTTLDLGMVDPRGIRCWSGGNKATLTVSATSATPSCMTGPIEPGTWKLLLGVPNIRPSVTANYAAEIFFTRTGLVADEPLRLRKPIRTGAAWYRGDLHLHTAHSDGSCKSLSDVNVPCPVFLTIDAAVRRGLDFIAISDHNATSHYAPMRELAPYFDTLLLIPGREITTFYGHANLFGTEEFLDFRLGSASTKDTNTMFREAARLGGMISLNHPGAPTGESCMGCGWDPQPPTDLNLVTAVEAINGGAEEGPYSGVLFWETSLNSGHRLTGIGGSDNHNALKALDGVSSVGSSTTVVYAAELSTPAILAGIRAGRVFVDLTGSKDHVLELTARRGDVTANMGDMLQASAGTLVEFFAHSVSVAGATLQLLEDGKPFAGSKLLILSAADLTTPFQWKSDGGRHWFRADVRGPDGKLWLLGNPIYVNWYHWPQEGI